MSEITEQRTPLTQEVVKSQINISLQRAELSFQNLYNREAKLVFNEDNLSDIKSFLDVVKQGKKVIEEKYAEIKRPINEETKAVDSARKALLSDMETVYTRVYLKYEKIIGDMKERQRREQEAAQRKATIMKGIDTNIIEFSTRIGAASTLEELTNIERSINLQKTRKEKYGEFLGEAIERLNQLGEAIATQKEKIKQLAKAKSEDEKERIQASIEEHKINVQEKAISSVTTSVTEVEAVHIPVPKAKRTIWYYEVTDIDLLAKKLPSLVKVVPNESALEDKLEEMKKKAEAEGKEEIALSGVRFYAKKFY